jgi:hypothetical protein
VFWREKVVVSYSSAAIPQLHHSNLYLSDHIHIYQLLRMHTCVRGGLYIYLHKMPGKHPGYGQMLGGEEFR